MADMTKPIPAIQRYMTTSPHTVGIEQTLAHAQDAMRTHSIRHLPVLHGGSLVGVVSQRDLALIEGLKGVDAASMTVEDAMSNAVYSCSPDAALDEVVNEMAEKKYGCAVVMQNQKVVGIFTTVDVCKALSELLHGRLAKS